eukprot:9811519-Karenia_brevis.AAC.1
MQAADQDTVKAMSCTNTARLVQKEFNAIRVAHMAGAAAEFQIYKIWELVQQLALKHQKLGAEALEASNKLQAIIQ